MKVPYPVALALYMNTLCVPSLCVYRHQIHLPFPACIQERLFISVCLVFEFLA